MTGGRVATEAGILCLSATGEGEGGADVVTTTDDGLVGQRMSWDDYWELPEELHAEYVDGAAYVSPGPGYTHQKISIRLLDLLRAQLPGAEVIVAAGWTGVVPRTWLRIPDVAVLARPPDGELITEAPVIAIEVLSSNRSDDRVRKYAEYFDAGAQQYWIVDPRDREVEVFSRGAGGWDSLARLTEEAPESTVATSLGDVTLALAAILG